MNLKNVNRVPPSSVTSVKFVRFRRGHAMATRPPHPCYHPGCRQLVRDGPRCPEHTRLQQRRDVEYRGTATQRGIDHKWRALRADHFARDPWCAECRREGRQTPAAILHHVREHRGDEALRLAPGNLRSLCRACHQRKVAREGPGYAAPRRC